ncbi:MAG: hypothetical protein ACRC0G_01650 [Fusobacteriaceae bacterium]
MKDKSIYALTCEGDYDFKFTDSGLVSVDSKTSEAVSSLLRTDLNCNKNWYIDNDLGINWVNAKNTGLLQMKKNEAQIVSVLTRKIKTIPGVLEIEYVEVKRTVSRKLYLRMIIKTIDGNKIEVEKEV